MDPKFDGYYLSDLQRCEDWHAGVCMVKEYFEFLKLFEDGFWLRKTHPSLTWTSQHTSAGLPHGRFRMGWSGEGVFETVLELLVKRAASHDTSRELFLDATFVRAKRGARKLAIPSAARNEAGTCGRPTRPTVGCGDRRRQSLRSRFGFANSCPIASATDARNAGHCRPGL